jgi:hypothetical protein
MSPELVLGSIFGNLSAIMRLYAIFFKGIPLIPPINDNITKRLRITLFTGFAIVIRNIALGCFYILNLYLEIFVFSQGLGLWVTGAKHNFKNREKKKHLKKLKKIPGMY